MGSLRKAQISHSPLATILLLLLESLMPRLAKMAKVWLS